MDKLISLAKTYAATAHRDQKYGDEFPYTVHLQAVESVANRFGIEDPVILAACWLHDTLEDCPSVEYEELETLFGQEIADVIAALTEPKGGNRKWRHEQTYPRIRQNQKAVAVKLCDRIANVESGGKKQGMYRKEHMDFKRSLIWAKFSDESLRKIVYDMWDALDELIAGVEV